jgi:hypothetical protein
MLFRSLGVFNPTHLVSMGQPYGKNTHIGGFSTLPEALPNLYKNREMDIPQVIRAENRLKIWTLASGVHGCHCIKYTFLSVL